MEFEADQAQMVYDILVKTLLGIEFNSYNHFRRIVDEHIYTFGLPPNDCIAIYKRINNLWKNVYKDFIVY